MPWNRPEDERQRDHKRSRQHADPDRAPQQQLLYVRLTDRQRAERRCLRLPQEHEDRVQFVLMRHEEEDCKAKREKQLRTNTISVYSKKLGR